jgi:DNA-binding beta-propeller fold protein YncE
VILALFAASILVAITPTGGAAAPASTSYAFAGQWGGPGTTGLNWPGGLTADASGNILVADTSDHRIIKFDPNGNYLAQWGGAGKGGGRLIAPDGIAIDPAGDNDVLDSSLSIVEKFDASGNFLLQWGHVGKGTG